MQVDGFYIERCKQIIEKKLEWGDSASWRTKDFETLSSNIFETTGISLSTSTLRRIWGHNRYDGHPNPATLDALAKFAGSTDWRSFQKSLHDENTPTPPAHISRRTSTRLLKKNIALFLGISLVGLLVAFAIRLTTTKEVFPSDGQFVLETKHVAEGIPNSVIFTYHVPHSVKDSIYIQQSWDSTKRVPVDRLDSTHTSIYYQPGIHHAKLLVGDSVVKEKTVVIRTKGWMGLIDNMPIPMYLDSAIYTHDGYITLDPKAVADHGVDMRSSPKSVQFFNIGNFEPLPIKDLYFSTELKHGYGEGASACQFSFVVLYTDQGNPIFVPISQKGCVSDLNLLMPDTLISGKKHDLSGFGTDIGKWTHLSCEAKNGLFVFSVNGEKAYEAAISNERVKVMGIGYFFHGTGAFRNILLRNRQKELDVFKDLF